MNTIIFLMCCSRLIADKEGRNLCYVFPLIMYLQFPLCFINAVLHIVFRFILFLARVILIGYTFGNCSP